jgi:hypothetical protein
MRVHSWAVLALGEVTYQRQQLALLVHRDTPVLLGRGVKPTDNGALEGADGSDLRRLEALGLCELRQLGYGLVAWVAYQDIGDNVRVLDNLGFHR